MHDFLFALAVHVKPGQYTEVKTWIETDIHAVFDVRMMFRVQTRCGLTIV